MATYYYAETDGEVYLVERDGVLAFPDREEALPFRVEKRFALPVAGHTVWFCKPLLDAHPSWVYKDTLAERPNVDLVVRKAVDQSQPRCVAAGVIVRDGKVCMVKAKRGHTRGFWNLPGGFVDYGEAPRETVRRELREELGADAEVGDLLGVFEHVFPATGRFMIAFVYMVTTATRTLRPADDELEAVAWMAPEEAAASTRNPFSVRALEALRLRQQKG